MKVFLYRLVLLFENKSLERLGSLKTVKYIFLKIKTNLISIHDPSVGTIPLVADLEILSYLVYNSTKYSCFYRNEEI